VFISYGYAGLGQHRTCFDQIWKSCLCEARKSGRTHSSFFMSPVGDNETQAEAPGAGDNGEETTRTWEVHGISQVNGALIKFLSSSYPHQWHFIWYMILYIYIFWQSIWHPFWHSIWHIFWALELAVEVRQCPLRSGTRSWNPRLPEEKEREKATKLKSRDPHLAGGGKSWKCMFILRPAIFLKRYAQMKMELHRKVKIKN
jgi:hypothetical protein